MDIHGTRDQQLIYLNTHWGRRYEFAAPGEPGRKWTATDKFGDHERLESASAPELLAVVRNHYEGNYQLRRL
jgi:hypothetical protein